MLSRIVRLLGFLAFVSLVVATGDGGEVVVARTLGALPSRSSALAAAAPVTIAATQLLRLDDALPAGLPPSADAAATTPAPTAVPTPAPTAAPTEDPATPPPATPMPFAVVAAARPVPPPPTAAPATPSGCPADWLCYPRLGIRGAIVPYTDCTGATNVGTAIRAFMCLSPRYLMGHAYTQMGLITGWQAGDVVYAYGQAYTVTGAVTEQSCQPPLLPLAPLSLQTSLSPNTCGPVLVVQAR